MHSTIYPSSLSLLKAVFSPERKRNLQKPGLYVQLTLRGLREENTQNNVLWTSPWFHRFCLVHFLYHTIKLRLRGRFPFLSGGRWGRVGYWAISKKKRSCTAKLPATAETKRVQKSSKFFYSPGPEFAPKKKPLIHNLKVPKKKITPQKSAHLTSSPPPPLPPATLSEK